ncbi:hypothetical protein X975_16154, partial [Stegodyphus mimosarum]
GKSQRLTARFIASSRTNLRQKTPRMAVSS